MDIKQILYHDIEGNLVFGLPSTEVDTVLFFRMKRPNPKKDGLPKRC